MYKGKWLCVGLHLYSFFHFIYFLKIFTTEQFSPINISLNSNLQNRYKQASLLELEEISKY